MNFKLFIVGFFLITSLAAHSASGSIIQIDDKQFIKLAQSEPFLIVLFSKVNCELCEAFEEQLPSLQDHFTENDNVKVVRIYNSNLVHLYSPSKEPALVFFRHGVPLLYHGEPEDDLIIHTFSENKEPVVKELDDKNFEHLTQVSSGRTTGDWFVMFYSKTCTTSRRLTARWEAVGAALRSRMNVARVNILDTGVATAKRFSVVTTPSFILFRNGNMYRYNLQSYEIEGLVHFASGGYKKIARSEPVPVPKSPFDEVVGRVADFLEVNDWLFTTGIFGIIMGFIAALWVKYREDQAKKRLNKGN